MGSEIIEVVERRRRWPVEVRLRILDEVLRPGASVAAINHHRAHIAERVAEADRESGLETVRDVKRRLVELQSRVERLVAKLEAGTDHRATLAGIRECREGWHVIADLMVASDLERRLETLEEQTRKRAA